MNIYYTIMERMVLETLQIREQSELEIMRNTSLPKVLLNQITRDLLAQNLILMENKKYKLNLAKNLPIKEYLTHSNTVLGEVSEIVTSCLKDKKNHQADFNLLKVSMTEREEKIYRGLIYNLESFLKSLKKSEEVKSQKVIFWGGGVYENIKNSIMFN